MMLSILPTLAFRTHKQRWIKVAFAGKPEWDNRNEVIASFIPPSCSVLDLGCGAQTIRGYLKPDCFYQPCDLVKSSPDTIVCDFNAGVYPDLKERFAVVVCSGVFEYIRKPKEFLLKITSLGDCVLFTFNPMLSGQSRLERMGNNWINHYNQDELEQIFTDLHLDSTILHVSENGELIYRLINTSPEC